MPPRKRAAILPPVIKAPSITFYRNIAVTFLVLTVLLLLAVAYMSVKKVTIRVVAQPVTLQASALARVGEKAEDMPHLAGATGKFDVELSREFAPTGTKEKETQATGTVVIKNTTARNQPLVATTRLLTADGILYRLKNTVTVPAGGTVEAAIYADKPGKASEREPRLNEKGEAERLTIPGLAESLQSKIYAELKTAVTGGVQKVGVVSDEDIKKAKEALRDAVRDEARKLLAAREKAGEGFGYAGAVHSIAFETSGTDQTEVSSFSVKAKAVVIAALYNKDAVSKLVNTRLQDKVARQPVKLVLGEAMPEVKIDSYDENGKWVQLAFAQSGVTYLTEQSPALDPMKFYGKSRADIEAYVRGIPGVQDVSVKFRPAWSDVAPRVPEHIEVRVAGE